MKKILIPIAIILLIALPLGAKNFLPQNQSANDIKTNTDNDSTAKFILSSDLYSSHNFGITANKVTDPSHMLSKMDRIPLVENKDDTSTISYTTEGNIYFSFVVQGYGKYSVKLTAADLAPVVAEDDPNRLFKLTVSVDNDLESSSNPLIVSERQKNGTYNTVEIYSNRNSQTLVTNDFGSYGLSVVATYIDKATGKNVSTAFTNKPKAETYSGQITINCSATE